MMFKKADLSQLKDRELKILTSLDERFNLRSLAKVLKTSAAGALSFASRLELKKALEIVR